MYYITGYSQGVNISQKVDLPTLCKISENLFCRSGSSYQTWYEIFVSPDDKEIWHFANQKRNYCIVIVFFDEV